MEYSQKGSYARKYHYLLDLSPFTTMNKVCLLRLLGKNVPSLIFSPLRKNTIIPSFSHISFGIRHQNLSNTANALQQSNELTVPDNLTNAQAASLLDFARNPDNSLSTLDEESGMNLEHTC